MIGIRVSMFGIWESLTTQHEHDDQPDGGVGEVEQGEGQPAEEEHSDHGDQKLAGPEKFRRAWTVSENQICQ